MISLASAVALVAIGDWEWGAVDSAPLRWILGAVLILGAVFALLMAIGTAPREPKEAWPAAVLAVGDKISLLRDDGSTRALSCASALANALRIGDVGVA